MTYIAQLQYTSMFLLILVSDVSFSIRSSWLFCHHAAPLPVVLIRSLDVYHSRIGPHFCLYETYLICVTMIFYAFSGVVNWVAKDKITPG